MKKTILINSIMILIILSFQNCRNISGEDEAPVSPLRTVTQRCADSTCTEELYPDPPVRDGHDWRTVSVTQP